MGRCSTFWSLRTSLRLSLPFSLWNGDGLGSFEPKQHIGAHAKGLAEAADHLCVQAQAIALVVGDEALGDADLGG